MHENFSDAKPTWKLWLSAQERPIASSSDEALWRRMHIIPWDNHIEEAADDHDLYDRLAAELPGILAWAIEGAQAWKRGGLQPPEAVKAAKADYRRTSDYIAQFIEDTCEVGGGKGVTSRVTTLYSAYTAWCKREGHHPIASNKFSGELHRRGYEATPALPRQAGVGRAGVYGLQIDPRIVDSDEDRGTRWFG
jgi:putative DNA primase/helicase